MRTGPKMAEAASIVATHPGCTKQFVSLRVGPNGSNFFGHAIVQRAIRAGLIRAEGDIRCYRLYPEETSR